jgi:hypothetical protein
VASRRLQAEINNNQPIRLTAAIDKSQSKASRRGRQQS